MSNEYKHGNRNKFLLRYHLIFVCKYRRRLLTSNNIIGDVKRLSSEIATKHNVEIKYMEVDKDHIHYMIETTPNINLSDFVRVLKQYTSYHMWQNTNRIYPNVSGMSVHFGLTATLLLLSER